METASSQEFILSAIAAACQCDVAILRPATAMQDLNIDSLRMVAIVSQVEAQYGRQFGAEEVIDFFMAERICDLMGLMGLEATDSVERA